MNLLKSLEKTKLTLCEGEKKSGKLSFALYCANKLDSKKVLILSAYSKKILQNRINAIKNQNISLIENILKKTKTLNLKENWEELKSKYGIEFLLKDIFRAMEKEKPDFIIFHRFDLIFDEYEDNKINYFLEKIIDHTENIKHIFFTTTVSEYKQNIIESIENFSDINLIIEKNDTERKIYVKNSIFPIIPTEYEFIIFNKKIEVFPKNHTEEQKSENNKIKILIITKNNKLFKKLNYIFDKKPFEIDYAGTVSEIIKKVLNNPDIIIFNPFEKKLDFSVCDTIKENSLSSKLIYIVNEDYIRSNDKLKAINHGCYDVFPLNFNLMDFIYEIEKILNINFYTINLEHLKNINKIVSIETICNIIDSLTEEKIYFTFAKVISSEKIEKNFLREYDFHFFQNGIHYFIFLNTTPDFIKNILNKFFKNYIIENIFEASEINEQIKEICK
ncbi:hypothetical protein [Caminibacter sp.]